MSHPTPYTELNAVLAHVVRGAQQRLETGAVWSKKASMTWAQGALDPDRAGGAQLCRQRYVVPIESL